jgi:hypothetical protein
MISAIYEKWVLPLARVIVQGNYDSRPVKGLGTRLFS